MTTNETDRAQTTSPASTILGALVGAGAAWARYGLALGRASLSASAKTLELTADVLGGVSRAIQDSAKEVRRPADAPESPSPRT